MLNDSCENLSGIGPTLAAKLAKCGIHTIQDLLFHLPYRYQDRTRITPIQDLRANDWSVITGKVCKTEIKYGKRMMLYCYVDDKTAILKLRFFHFNQQQVALMNESHAIRAFGEVKEFANTLEMIHPEYQLLSIDQDFTVEETLTPIYPTTEGLSQKRLRQLVRVAFNSCQQELRQLEWMKNEQLETLQFMPMASALACLHNPPPDIALRTLEEGHHPALKRLAFDELLANRLSMQFARGQRMMLTAPPFKENKMIEQQFLSALPFSLTGAQQRVYCDIKNDVAQRKPMLRLVQGDVGAGKTVIAALAALLAINNGYQVALMAPTDILSEQHFNKLLEWFVPLKISVLKLSGKTKAKERKLTLAALEDHTCQLIVGTHALFQATVNFAKLGLVIIDEQHRFGVTQRLDLQQKGQTATWTPHQLLLTATPIPRTLAMTQFAHLDISLLDELPPGRTPVHTAVVSQEKRQMVIARLEDAINQGRQIYWVCTLIEDSEKLQCMAATATAENLQVHLPNKRIGLIHGRMKAVEKEAIMSAFKNQDLDILVATTVIEVGVDVPNASLMIIENAERLGLSQLHQLRGRVGRGTIKSHCILIYQAPLSTIGHERLQVMRETNDGFIIAEKDLQLRGAGEFLGTRQTGYRQFCIANLDRDQALLPSVVSIAKQLLTDDPLTGKLIAKRWLGHFESFLQG
ncbi:MAG: ATP-dependent DNA helicase RecG [Legionella sp.]